MVFSVRELSVLAYANGFTLWHYKAPGGGLPNATEPGFFEMAGDLLASGDMVLVSSPTGGRVLCVAAGAAGPITAPLG